LKKILNLITPCSRANNLFKIKKTINFDRINKWIIIYDTSVIKTKKKLFTEHKNIIEFFHKDKLSVSGNSQRNYALEYLNKKKNKNFFIYFLDDDNILHKNFYKVIDNFDNDKMNFIYTFDQLRKQKIYINNQFQHIKILKGNIIKTGYIDIAMFLPNFSLINNIRWPKKKYTADGEYIVKCMKNNKNKHRYLPLVASHYNFISNNVLNKIKDRVLKIYKRKYKKSMVTN
jgi:hypothetical protein